MSPDVSRDTLIGVVTGAMSQLCVLSMLLLCHLALMASSLLVPPRNITLISENFQHVLKWKDENEPPGYYCVQYKELYELEERPVDKCCNITPQSCDLTDYFTDINEIYRAAVRSFRGNLTTEWSWSPSLCPLENTRLGPPIVDVVASEGSINVTIRPPKSHLKSTDGKSTLSMLNYDIYVKLIYTIEVVRTDKAHWSNIRLTEEASTETFTTTIPDLLPNTNYCISVSASASSNINSHQIPSAYLCVITREGDDPSTAYIPWVAVCVFALLIGFILILIALDRSGYICINRKLFPKVLKSLPKSYSVYEETKESVCRAYVGPIQIISKSKNEEESDASDEESCGQAYTQRKQLEIDQSAGDSGGGLSSVASSLMESTGQDDAHRKSLVDDARSDRIIDNRVLLSSARSSLIESSGQDYGLKKHLHNAESDRSKGDSSGLLSSATLPLMDSCNQSCRSATVGVPGEHQPILHIESCLPDTPLCSVEFTSTSSLPLNSNEPANVNLNSVLVRNSEDIWTGFKNEVVPGSSPQLRLFTSVDISGVSVGDVSSCEEDFDSEASDASNSHEHFASDYMRK
ncbi:uncharacterized protein O3C94_002021 [Discoglossus pictus]